MNVTLIPILNDNYAYLIEGKNGSIAVVDPGEAGPVIDVLEKRGLGLDTIFCTHHHGDHVAGVDALKSKYDCSVIGPEKDKGRIAGLDQFISDNDILEFDGEELHAIETPGHTLNHICYYAPESHVLFAGDTLFSLGCGRVFEGTMAQMHASLQKLASLPDETLLYCGHEYTLSNAEFCVSAAPDNADLQNRYEDVKALRAENKPTLPISLGTEKQTNVFLLANSVEEFADLRKRKDSF